MESDQIKKVEKELWDAADDLRANSKLTASEYKDPVLGLILLRFAENRFNETLQKIEKNISKNPRTGKKEITKDHFIGEASLYLREQSKYEYLASLPESKDISEAVNNAMRLIEKDHSDLSGILPKNYQSFDSDLLRGLIRIFNKESIKTISGDVFGRIYEYFLMKFSMSGAGAQEGGEFYTPSSLVQLIVNFIEPDKGIVYDPACGSGGMFIQTGYFVKEKDKKNFNEKISIYGTELKENTTKLAKMNLAIHGLEGKIIESNSFYSDPHKLIGKCDYVIANPPFNVKKVDKKKDYVKNDLRLKFGLPKNDNGNYLWIQYFYSYLNEKGRSGFIMPSSAGDAGASEKIIKKKLIETGHIEAIISISNNFFYTKSLPCHVWFLNKKNKNQNKVLMINARNIFRKVNQTINDFTPEQLEGLTTIIKSYRGEKVDYKKNEWLRSNFVNNCYEDIEGICKITSFEEIAKNEYSLNPGRYVGFKIEIDHDFDFKGRIKEIKSELEILQNENEELFKQIQKMKI